MTAAINPIELFQIWRRVALLFITEILLLCTSTIVYYYYYILIIFSMMKNQTIVFVASKAKILLLVSRWLIFAFLIVAVEMAIS